MLGQLGIGPLDARLVAAGRRDGALELIGDNGGRDPAVKGEGPRVARDPVGQLLGRGRLSVRVARGAEGRDEELHLDRRPRAGVEQARVLARVVDEELLAGVVHLAHRERPPREPAPVDVAELRVAVAVGVPLAVLEVQEGERDAPLAPLGVEVGTVRLRPGACAARPFAVQPGGQGLLGQRGHLRPLESGHGRPVHRGADRADAHPQAACDVAMRAPEQPLLPQNLACLSHG